MKVFKILNGKLLKITRNFIWDIFVQNFVFLVVLKIHFREHPMLGSEIKVISDDIRILESVTLSLHTYFSALSPAKKMDVLCIIFI